MPITNYNGNSIFVNADIAHLVTRSDLAKARLSLYEDVKYARGISPAIDIQGSIALHPPRVVVTLIPATDFEQFLPKSQPRYEGTRVKKSAVPIEIPIDGEHDIGRFMRETQKPTISCYDAVVYHLESYQAPIAFSVVTRNARYETIRSLLQFNYGYNLIAHCQKGEGLQDAATRGMLDAELSDIITRLQHASFTHTSRVELTPQQKAELLRKLREEGKL